MFTYTYFNHLRIKENNHTVIFNEYFLRFVNTAVLCATGFMKNNKIT